MPIPAPRIPIIAASAIMAFSGASRAAVQVIDDTQPIEWVTISIHMPDGRVIETVEHRYPSRSRVHIKTGEIPAFKPAAQAPSDSAAAESIVTELSEDEYQQLEAGFEGAIDGTAEQPIKLNPAIDPPADAQPIEAEQSEPEPTGAVRAFKKTIKS